LYKTFTIDRRREEIKQEFYRFCKESNTPEESIWGVLLKKGESGGCFAVRQDSGMSRIITDSVFKRLRVFRKGRSLKGEEISGSCEEGGGEGMP